MAPEFALLGAVFTPLAAFSPCAQIASAGDPRTSYDVLAYRLDIRVDPENEQIRAWCAVDARVGASEIGTLELDMDPQLAPDRVLLLERPDLAGELEFKGAALEYEHTRALLECKLGHPLAPGTRFCVAIHYSGSPHNINAFDGFHWNKTASGAPYIATSVQGTGSKIWWPCKDSFFHPEDKPERTFVNATVPQGLYAVSNGRLVARVKGADDGPDKGLETFRWRHEYPCETYAITLDVAPYVVVESKLKIDGLEKPLDYIYYVLPEDAEKAELQFADVPRIVQVYSEAFGPFPFPESKFGLVEVPFFGMEHSTAVAYGSSFPAWCKLHDQKDRFAPSNDYYDYILVHEVAHEWWGNAVSAGDWSDFWLHEGFATYAEGLYVERTQGREVADKWWQKSRTPVPKKGSLYRGKGSDSKQAYSNILYYKGAWVLHTLRDFVDDDPAWFKTLRDFNLAFRYRNAMTGDFRALLEKNTERKWGQFFDEWFYGSGYPLVDGKVFVCDTKLALEIDVKSTTDTPFHVPLDLEWTEDSKPKATRVMLAPEHNAVEIMCEFAPRDVKVVHTERVLGNFEVRVKAKQ
jgi:aminopeptidase N